MERTKVYFTADVHLGLATADPKEREDRFVSWTFSDDTIFIIDKGGCL